MVWYLSPHVISINNAYSWYLPPDIDNLEKVGIRIGSGTFLVVSINNRYSWYLPPDVDNFEKAGISVGSGISYVETRGEYINDVYEYRFWGIPMMLNIYKRINNFGIGFEGDVAVGNLTGKTYRWYEGRPVPIDSSQGLYPYMTVGNYFDINIKYLRLTLLRYYVSFHPKVMDGRVGLISVDISTSLGVSVRPPLYYPYLSIGTNIDAVLRSLLSLVSDKSALAPPIIITFMFGRLRVFTNIGYAYNYYPYPYSLYPSRYLYISGGMIYRFKSWSKRKIIKVEEE